VHLEASTKPHVHQKFQIFWTNIAFTMACPNFKNGPKNSLGPLGVKLKFGGGNLFSPAMTSTIEGNNSVGSLLEPLLKNVMYNELLL
jgi:hypothetical protein